MKKLFLVIAGMAMLMFPVISQADIYGFGNITANSLADAAIGELQLSVEVTATGTNQVKFEFSNAGPGASSITDVYFDDGTLLGIAAIIEGPGVAFSQGASPGNLPGGNGITPAFVASAGFTADSDSPATQANGVNPGEHLEIIFDLLPGVTFADTISALNSLTDLRIGIHVQGFAGGGSESFVHRVPEPGSMMLLGIGLVGLAGWGRKKYRR